MKKTDETQIPELGLEIKGTTVFFTIDGQRKLKMTCENYLRCISSDLMGTLARKAASPEEDFAELGLAEYITAERLLKKGLSMDQCARVQKIPEDRLRKFYSYGREQFKGSGADGERKTQEAEGHDYCKQLPGRDQYGKPAPQGYKLLDVSTVNQLMKTGISLTEIASKLDLEITDFYEWLKVNQPLFDLFKK